MIRMTGVVYEAGTFRLDLSLDVRAGEYFVLMGPTGSGKTAAIECLAGLRAPRAGRIEIAGRDVTDEDPRTRRVGYVPQDYALFRHRSVRGNIAFAPEMAGLDRTEIERRVREAAAMLGIEPLLARGVRGLSGGERQRVALARALAMKPDALALDEPVSALDESNRDAICRELRRLQRDLNLTTIHVSHNLDEAFSVADRAAVLREGRIEQVGAMGELLRRPRNAFVARFMRCENLFEGRAVGPHSPETTLVRTDGAAFVVPGRLRGAIVFMVRPENWTLSAPGSDSAAPRPGALCARVARIEDRGAYVRLELSGARRLIVHATRAACDAAGVAEGAETVASAPPESVYALPGADSL